MENAHTYDVEVIYQKERLGSLHSTVLSEELSVATPPEFPNGMKDVWSPEHYFVAAVNGCLMTTFLAIAENFKLNFESFKSSGEGKLEKVDQKFMMSEITLRPLVVVSSEDVKEKALKVLMKAEAACLISNSIKSKIIFEPEVIVAG